MIPSGEARSRLHEKEQNRVSARHYIGAAAEQLKEVNMQDNGDFYRRLRTFRRFEQEPVPDEVLTRLVDNARIIRRDYQINGRRNRLTILAVGISVFLVSSVLALSESFYAKMLDEMKVSDANVLTIATTDRKSVV